MKPHPRTPCRWEWRRKHQNSVICCWASVAVMSYVAIATIPERSLDRLIDALDVEVQFRVLPVAGATIVHACFEQMLHQGPWN